MHDLKIKAVHLTLSSCIVTSPSLFCINNRSIQNTSMHMGAITTNLAKAPHWGILYNTSIKAEVSLDGELVHTVL